MALDITDDFWRDIVRVAASVGHYDQAIGQAVRFLELAQRRYKTGRIITETEFKKEGFHESLIGVFAEKIDGGFMAFGAEKHFSWINKRRQSGSKGGLASAESRRSEINNLASSKSKQTPSKSNLLSLSFSLEESKDSSRERVPPEAPPSVEQKKISEICDAWNLLVTSLPKVKSSLGKRRVLILRSLKENPDLEYWRRVFQKVEASDFLSGRNGRWTACNFDWILSNDKNGIRNHVRVDEGVHDNRQGAKVQRQQQQAATDWVIEAEAILEAVRRFGANNPAEAQKFLGDTRWGYVRKAGGLYRIGQMPRNDFTSKQLAGILRASCEQQNTPSERTAKNASLEHQDQKFHERSGGGNQTRPDQPGGRKQQSGQIDDTESLRIRGEGIVGLFTGPSRRGLSGSDSGAGGRNGDSSSPIGSGKTIGDGEQRRICNEEPTGIAGRDVRGGLIQPDRATGPKRTSLDDNVEHRHQGGSEEALRPAWDSSGETSDGEL